MPIQDEPGDELLPKVFVLGGLGKANMENTTGWCLIPPTILVRKDLKPNQKMLLGRVIGLSNGEGYCFASNRLLGAEMGAKAMTISHLLQDLQKKGLVRIEIERDSRKFILKRKIYPLYPKQDIGISQTVHTPISQTTDTPISQTSKTVVNIHTQDLTNVKSTSARKRASSCPLDSVEHYKDLREKYPNGHKECVDYLLDVESEIGHAFINKPKQFKNLHSILRGKFTFKSMDWAIDKIKTDQFYIDKGWDFANVAAYLERKSHGKQV